MSDLPLRPDRRRLLALTGAAPLALTACRPALAAKAAPDALTLTPQATQGPYWFDPKLFRADITEGKTGVPARVVLTVLDQAGGPLKGARVDIWHCDASGLYSGYAGQGEDHQKATKGQTFLRGAQVTDAAGLAAFQTIWPGWYEGRTPHIHIKVFLDARTTLTCQLFVPDALSEYLYENVPAYKRPHQRDTLNRNDGIALQGGRAMMASVRETPTGYEVSLTLAVDPSTDWKDRGFGPGGPGGPPPPAKGGMGGPRRSSLTGEARLKAMVPGL